jgi:hypothetical protein
MSKPQQSFTALVWQMKWWWMVPLGVIATLFALLVVFSDTTGDAPFVYTLF